MAVEKQIVDAARSYLGVPFAHQGRSRLGLDCLGLLVCVARDCNLQRGGLNLSRFDETAYGHYPDANYLQQQLDTALLRCDELMVGGVVLMQHDGAARHLGIIGDYRAADGFTLIHAYAPARKVVEHRLDEHWQARIVQHYKLALG